MTSASRTLAAAMVPVTIQVADQPPLAETTNAINGGVMNCPNADPCCISPVVVDTVCLLGANAGVLANSVPGINPPAAEKASTAA